MKSFPAAQVPLIERPHAEPLYFVHIYLLEETLYFSDRNFKFNGHDYEAYLLEIPETMQSIDQFGGYLNINARLTFWNKRFRAYDRLIDFFIANPLTRRETDLFVLYISDGVIPGSDVSTKLNKFCFGELKDIGTEMFRMELFSIVHSIDHKKLFTQINRTIWPNAAPDAIGKYENLIYGSLRGIPCHPVDVGAVSTLYQGMSATATEIYLSDVDYPVAFPSSGTVRIGLEQITYTGKDSVNKRLTGCTRGLLARAYERGEPVWQIKATYKYLAASQKMKTISNVYVSGIRVAPGDRTLNLNDGGKSTITFTSKALLANQGAHSHGSKITEPWYPTGSSWTYDAGQGAWGVAANLRDRNEGTGCGQGITGSSGEKNAYYTVTFPSWPGPTPTGVSVYVVCYWDLGFQAGEFFNLTAPQTIPIGVQGYYVSTYTAKLKLTGTSVPTTVTIQSHCNMGGLVRVITGVYEIWLVLEFDNIASGGEHSVWSKLAPLVSCDGEGFADDGSGTYTGTPNALVQNSSDVRRHLLVDRLGRSMSDIGDSFASVRTTYANRISGGYNFATILSSMGNTPEEIFRKLDQQSRSQMREDGGKFELAFHGDSEPSSVMTIDKTIYIGDPVFSQTPAAEIKNLIRAVFDFDYSGLENTRRFGGYLQQKQVSDTPSITKYGELPEDIAFPVITTALMAEDVANWLLRQKKDVIPLVELRCKKQTAKLERNDYFTLNDVPVVSWEGKKWRIFDIHQIPFTQNYLIKAIQWI